jgi:hypothetical protein
MALFGTQEKLPNFKFKTVGDVFQITLTEDSGEYHVKNFVDGKPGDHLYWSPEGGRPQTLKDIPTHLQALARPLMGAVVTGVDADGVAYRHFLSDRQLKAAQDAYKAAVKENPNHQFKNCFEQGGVLAALFEKEEPGKGPVPRKVIVFKYQPPTEG